MVDDLKNRGDRILRNILGSIAGSVGSDDENGTRDLLIGLLSKAGKGKDEFVQILGREIGLALAAVLSKPLEQMTETKRIRITVELVPKTKKSAKSSRSKPKRKA